MSSLTVDLFSGSFTQARERFMQAALARTSRVTSYETNATGADAEVLSTDVALLGPGDATKALLVTSGVHGVEGFCGSACQIALLSDNLLIEQAASQGIAILLVHAINPYGFSWCSRADEANVDLNRNALQFSQPGSCADCRLPGNAGYFDLHSLLVPEEWPPTPHNRQALAEWAAKLGTTAWRETISRGQYDHSDGLFYGGSERRPALQTLERVFADFAHDFADIAWIDVHSGLGRRGHGEKIYAGRHDDAEGIRRCRRLWGPDVRLPLFGESASVAVTGNVALMIHEALPKARVASIGIEFGTVPFDTMIDALRGDAWLRCHPRADAELMRSIRKAMRDAFNCEQEDWQGMVLGQFRTLVLQALCGQVGCALHL